MGKLETLNKAMQWETVGEGKWPDGENGKALDGAMEHLVSLWWRNVQIRDPSNGEIEPPGDLMGKLGALNHLLFSNGLIRLHCTLSNLWAPNFNWEILDDMQAEKKNHEAPILHISSHISKIVWWLPMFDFGIFCHLFRLMGIYQVGASSGYLKSFVPSFLFFLFSFLSSFSFSFFFSFFFLSLSRGPLL